MRDQNVSICWILGKAREFQSYGIPDGITELFQVLKDDAVEVLHSNMPANLENSAVATGLEKTSFHSNPKESQCQRMLNYRTIALILHTSKVILRILQMRLQRYVN